MATEVFHNSLDKVTIYPELIIHCVFQLTKNVPDEIKRTEAAQESCYYKSIRSLFGAVSFTNSEFDLDSLSNKVA